MSTKNTQRTVTIVDDDAGMHLILECYIWQFDPEIKITKFTQPFDAMMHVRENKPDLLITDFNMPKMSGDDLSFAVQVFHEYLPVVLFSGTSDITQFPYLAIMPKCSFVSQVSKWNSIFKEIFKKA